MIRLAMPNFGEEEFEAVKEVLKSGYLVQGGKVAQLESMIADYVGTKYAVALSSGTAALHLALMALEIGPDDEVIVPAFTFPATANVVEIVGATPVLVDIVLNDFCINTSKIESALTPKTKAIMPVHEFGQAADMDPIIELAKKHDLKIIEDAACALGTEYNEKKVGNFGILGCFSFHPRKVITTGEGGAGVTSEENLANRIRALRNHGLTDVHGSYDLVCAGLNYRMTEMQAAIGICQLLKLKEMNSKRNSIAKQYNEELKEVERVKTPTTFPNRKHIFQTYHILLDEKLNRDELILNLRNYNIETNLGAQALHCLFYYKNKYDFVEMDYPNAFMAYKQGLALPMGSHLQENDISFICGIIKESIWNTDDPRKKIKTYK